MIQGFRGNQAFRILHRVQLQGSKRGLPLGHMYSTKDPTSNDPLPFMKSLFKLQLN